MVAYSGIAGPFGRSPIALLSKTLTYGWHDPKPESLLVTYFGPFSEESPCFTWRSGSEPLLHHILICPVLGEFAGHIRMLYPKS